MKLALLLAFGLIASARASFEARVVSNTVFATGHVFSLGQCAAVATKVSSDCYHDMPAKVLARLQDTNLTTPHTCVTHIQKTPCIYGEIKYTATSSGYIDCAEMVLLYEDAMEDCLRRDADGRFWYSVLYWVAILFGIALVGGMLSALTSCA